MRYMLAAALALALLLAGWALVASAGPSTSEEIQLAGVALETLPGLQIGDAESARLGAAFPLLPDGTQKMISWLHCAKAAQSELQRPSTAIFPLDDAPYSVTSNGGASYEVETYVEAEDRLGRRHRLPFVCRVSDPMGDHGPSLILRWQ